MTNDFDLKRALEQLQKEIQKETAELNSKRTAVTAIDAEKIKLEKELSDYSLEKKKKEAEVLELTRKIGQAEKRIADIKRDRPKLEEEVKKKTADLSTKNVELQKHQEGLRSALAKLK